MIRSLFIVYLLYSVYCFYLVNYSLAAKSTFFRFLWFYYSFQRVKTFYNNVDRKIDSKVDSMVDCINRCRWWCASISITNNEVSLNEQCANMFSKTNKVVRENSATTGGLSRRCMFVLKETNQATCIKEVQQKWPTMMLTGQYIVSH